LYTSYPKFRKKTIGRLVVDIAKVAVL